MMKWFLLCTGCTWLFIMAISADLNLCAGHLMLLFLLMAVAVFKKCFVQGRHIQGKHLDADVARIPDCHKYIYARTTGKSTVKNE